MEFTYLWTLPWKTRFPDAYLGYVGCMVCSGIYVDSLPGSHKQYLYKPVISPVERAGGVVYTAAPGGMTTTLYHSPQELLVILKLKNPFGEQLSNTFPIIPYYSGPLALLGKNPLRESDQTHTYNPGALIHFPSTA